MSHSAVALLVVAFGAGVGAWRLGPAKGTLRTALAVALAAVAFHTVELLAP